MQKPWDYEVFKHTWEFKCFMFSGGNTFLKVYITLDKRN